MWLKKAFPFVWDLSLASLSRSPFSLVSLYSRRLNRCQCPRKMAMAAYALLLLLLRLPQVLTMNADPARVVATKCPWPLQEPTSNPSSPVLRGKFSSTSTRISSRLPSISPLPSRTLCGPMIPSVRNVFPSSSSPWAFSISPRIPSRTASRTCKVRCGTEAASHARKRHYPH